jgi:dihydrodipicolinate synthase/N-acetylneuraminate lyase
MNDTPPLPLASRPRQLLRSGGVFVPSPLALDAQLQFDEDHQRLLTLYYLRAGAKAVIPGAHTGEFALHDSALLGRWMHLVKEMTQASGGERLLMAAVGSAQARGQAELAASMGYDLVMVAPTAFAGLDEAAAYGLLRDIAGVIPVFAFELQRAIPSSYSFSPSLWDRIFCLAWGAKGASFDTYRSLQMLEAAARSPRREELTLLTGNDDRIVADLAGQYAFGQGDARSTVHYAGGLLGHFATDTRAAVHWVEAILRHRRGEGWRFALPAGELAHAVNRCNMALFDALGNFENSVWGVKYRLHRLGLLPGPWCRAEQGRPGQAEAIDRVYAEYPELCDEAWLEAGLPEMKRQLGIKT